MASTLLALFIGLGVFLYGMHQLETHLQHLASDRVKHWLGRATQNPLSSVASGTFITAILQSSSMVSLLVLAFASAGMIPLFNAIGVILGANLGTTFTGWVVATIGFKLDLTSFAFPLFGIGALIFVFSNKATKRYAVAGLILGFGLLLVGLEQMKLAVEGLPNLVSTEFLSQLNTPLYLLFGIVMTAIVQSSSAMTLIALTALSSGAIDLSAAASIIVGADIGTTSTTAIGSIRSSAVAKQLALSHVIYNVCVDTFAFFVMVPLLPSSLAYLGINDPLYGLVLFHSAFNLIGLFFFVPFLKPYSLWLSRFFVVNNDAEEGLSHQTSTVPETALLSLLKSLEDVLARVVSLNLRSLSLEGSIVKSSQDGTGKLLPYLTSDRPFIERYRETKGRESAIHQYIASSVLNRCEKNYDQVITEVTTATRYAIYSAKTLKDVKTDLALFHRAKEAAFNEEDNPDTLALIYREFCHVLLTMPAHQTAFKMLHTLKTDNETLHNLIHEKIVQGAQRKAGEYSDLATLLNTNRELWHANVNLINALEHLINARVLTEQLIGNRAYA